MVISSEGRQGAPVPGDGHAHRAPARLTPARARVLDILRKARRALGAYDIIEIAARESGRRVAPISVYRALDFLREEGLVHRLESRNAFLACDHGHRAREATAFLICEICGRVREEGSAALGGELAAIAARRGFAAHSASVELCGRCADCAVAA